MAPTQGPEPWRGKELRVVRLVDDSTTVTIPEGVSITFLWSSDGRVAGKAPVNRYFGSLEEFRDGRVHWNGGVASTRMGGPPGLMILEATFLKVLGAVSRSSGRERSLVLSAQDGRSEVELAP